MKSILCLLILLAMSVGQVFAQTNISSEHFVNSENDIVHEGDCSVRILLADMSSEDIETIKALLDRKCDFASLPQNVQKEFFEQYPVLMSQATFDKIIYGTAMATCIVFALLM